MSDARPEGNNTIKLLRMNAAGIQLTYTALAAKSLAIAGIATSEAESESGTRKAPIQTIINALSRAEGAF